MIVIPELQVVVILTPRAGSGSLRRAIANAYPRSMLLYRHMEADGVPHGYDRWQKVGIIRHPVQRLWSLYKFLKHFGGDHDPAYIAAQRASVSIPFSDWILENQLVFTAPYDWAGTGRFFPRYTVRHPLPENRKSQFLYLRPDLGTTIFPYRDMGLLADRLGITLENHNSTERVGVPLLSNAALEHCSRYFAWDYENCEVHSELRHRMDAFAPDRTQRLYA